MARIPLQPDRGDRGEIVELARVLLEYARDKGQIPSAAAFAILETYSMLLKRLGAEKLGEALEHLPRRVIELSPHEPRRYETVWQYVVAKLSEGLVTRVEMVEQKRKHTKVVEA